MDAGINNVIYMELYSGPKMANGRCGKTIDTGTIDRGSTVYCDGHNSVWTVENKLLPACASHSKIVKMYQ